MFGEIKILVWIILFIVYFAFDILYTRYIMSVTKLKAIQAANISVIMYGLTALGTIQYVENLLNIIPIVIGSWVGTYVIIRYEIRKKKKNEISNSRK